MILIRCTSFHRVHHMKCIVYRIFYVYQCTVLRMSYVIGELYYMYRVCCIPYIGQAQGIRCTAYNVRCTLYDVWCKLHTTIPDYITPLCGLRSELMRASELLKIAKSCSWLLMVARDVYGCVCMCVCMCMCEYECVWVCVIHIVHIYTY